MSGSKPPVLAAIALASSLGALAGCSSTPPPQWQSGGAPLEVRAARWTMGNGATVDLRSDGKVVVDGSQAFSIDRAGRVFDTDNDPIAILLPDGNLVGPDDVYLGRIGIANASPPGRETAWVAVLPDGSVLRFDPDGDRSADGVWRGCEGGVHRACTLVTHLVELDRAAASRGHVFVGVGFGLYP
jgi:hypothetical protein